MEQSLIFRYSVYIMPIDSIITSVIFQEFTADIYMRQIWNDTRLTFDNRGSALVLQHEVLNKLWLPDTYFENAAKTFVQQETRTVVLFGDGLVVYSQR